MAETITSLMRARLKELQNRQEINYVYSVATIDSYIYIYIHTSSSLFTFQGEFIQTVKTERGLYGLTMAAIEQVAQQGLACVTHMSLEV